MTIRVASNAGVRGLRGREPELLAVGEHLAALAGGHGGVLLIEGAAGIGKSSLLAEARAMARRVGARPLSGEAFASQQAVPFGPLLAATVGARPPIGDAGTVRDRGGHAAMRYWIVHDLQAALESAALHTPLTIVLDDLQWADTGTLVALSALTTGLSDVPILWILATRNGEGRARDTMSRLERDGAHRLRIGALPEAAVAAVVADVLAAEADQGLLELAAKARGSPFLLVELLLGLREEGRLRIRSGRATVVGHGLPGRVAATMHERLDRLSDDGRQLVRVAAVLAHRFSAEQLAAMLRRRPSTLVDALEEALRADLLVEAGDQLGFRHDLVRQAVLETLPRSLRRALQREAVTVLLESGAAPVEVALQLAESAEVGDRSAIATLRDAAHALAASDAASAADLSVRALELLPPSDDERGPLVAETVVLLHMALRTDEAQALGRHALAGVLAPEQEAEVRLSLAGIFDLSPAARLAENRRALDLPGLSATIRARHLGWRSYNRAMCGLPAQPGIATADADSRDLQAHTMATLGLACSDSMRGACTDALERTDALRRLTRTAEPEPYLLLVDFHHANVLAEMGRLDAAMELLAAGIDRGRRERNAWLLEAWQRYGSGLRLALGQLADARAEAGSIDSLAEGLAAGRGQPAWLMLTPAAVAAHTGDARLLGQAACAAEPLTRSGSPQERRAARWIMVLAAIARDDPAAAARWLDDDELPYAMPALPMDPGRQPTVARIAVAAGDGELARRALEVAETIERRSPGVALFAATAVHTRGLVQGDGAALREAADRLRATQRPLLFAAAAEDAGRALMRGDRRADAVDALNEAFDAFIAHEATADARRVGRLLRDLGVGRRIIARERPQTGWESLTESELRVVRLVAGGATNRTAAERLFLSPHTVSSHLRSAFTKLDINSRVELARVAVEQDRPSALAG